MKIQPYLYFNGRAEEAIEFYKKSLGAEVAFMMRFKESPEQQPGMMPPGSENKIMHADVRIGESTFLISDGHCSGSVKFEGIALSLTVANEAESQKAFNALAQGGQVQLPLTKTFFSKSFGMVTDCFGVSWLVYVPTQM